GAADAVVKMVVQYAVVSTPRGNGRNQHHHSETGTGSTKSQFQRVDEAASCLPSNRRHGNAAWRGRNAYLVCAFRVHGGAESNVFGRLGASASVWLGILLSSETGLL